MPRTTHRRLPWGAGLLALLVAGSTAATAPVATAASTDATAEDVVVSTDFSDGTYAPWTASGGPALSVVPVDGDPALLVSGRAADFDGIQTPTGLLEPGVAHTFTMQARLAAGTTGTAGVRFVVKPSYTWVGNTTMTADAWTTVSGTFTPPADADPAALQVYLGTADLAGATGPYDYLVDDIVITRAGDGGGEDPWVPTPDPSFVPGGAVDPTETPVSRARGTGDVAALTFDDGPNPGETDRLLDHLAANEITATFCVIGQNITADGGAEILRRIVGDGHTLCNHSTGYADMGSYTQAQVEADLTANLAIIRAALGDPDAQVPYFRAPNGSWGVTPEVAVALGMQPLGLGNVIFDWDGNDLSVETLTANLRAAVTPGAVVLAHDGGGDRENTVTAVETVVDERLAAGWTFTLPEGGAGDPVAGPGDPDAGPGLMTSFEDGLDGWGPRGDADGDPTVAVTTSYARTGSASAQVSDRTSQGDGIGRDVTGLLTTGTTYDISAWVRFAPGAETDDIWLSMASTSDGTQSFSTLGQFTGITADGWTEITATYQVPDADSLFLYLETAYAGGATGTTGTFLVDDITITPREALEVEDLTPLKDTVPFPVGVAIDERETTGAAAQLLTRHFDQVTGENHMKPEAWYGGAGPDSFRLHPQAEAIMDFAQAEDLAVYGHVLVWHAQTPAWFFTAADGTPLTTSEADQQVLRDRMRTHIFSVAETLATQYGPFGSDTNPLTAWDVVNEVVSDSGEYSDGLRRSEWYRVLGEEFIDLAFVYADEAFNETYAAEGSDRPVTLFINDYNTEQSGKQDRYRALVERLLARGVPLDGVGHQFHVSLSFPVEGLEAAIVRFEDLGLTQVVTELDVTTGTPVTEALLVDQGYYYRDAFAAFRRQAEDLYSVTVWGLTDGRSWRASSGDPLLFGDALEGKPAYYGAAGLELPARQRSAFVFAGDVALDGDAVTSPVWDRLPLLPVDQVADFQLRWQADHLTAYVSVSDPTVGSTDGLTFVVDGVEHTVRRDGTGSVQGVVTETATGYDVVVHLPVTGAAEGDQVGFDVVVTDGTTTTGWNLPGALGTLTLVEPLSYTETVETSAAPTIDGVIESAWSSADVVRTDTQIEGTGGATAAVRTLWKDQTLYVLAEVTDPTLDATGSDPWIQDSLEIFLDAGNVKNGPYRYDDTQIRISYLNVTSFGTGDEAFQENRLVSATQVVDGGYVVEASISLLDSGGLGTFHGLDFQVNDATDGSRTSIRSWGDPTGLGYQTTARWGVTQLVAAPDVEPEPEPQPEPDPVVTVDRHVRSGGTVEVDLSGFVAGSTVELTLSGRKGASYDLGSVVVDADGSATATVTVPSGADRGRQTLTASAGSVTASAVVVVQGPVTPVRGRS